MAGLNQKRRGGGGGRGAGGRGRGARAEDAGKDWASLAISLKKTLPRQEGETEQPFGRVLVSAGRRRGKDEKKEEGSNSTMKR